MTLNGAEQYRFLLPVGKVGKPKKGQPPTDPATIADGYVELWVYYTGAGGTGEIKLDDGGRIFIQDGVTYSAGKASGSVAFRESDFTGAIYAPTHNIIFDDVKNAKGFVSWFEDVDNR